MESHKEASAVTAAQGQVLVDGPNGVAVSLTPDAATELAARLIKGAAEAREQQADPAQD